MLEVTRVTISPNLPLIGKDLDAEATLNADVTGTQPDLWAGTIMVFSVTGPPANEMRRALTADFGAVPSVTFVWGILAADSYQMEDLVTNRPAMIYRAGTFIRSTINDVNTGYVTTPIAPIIPGDARNIFLAGLGIYMEESWDDPALGVPPV